MLVDTDMRVRRLVVALEVPLTSLCLSPAGSQPVAIAIRVMCCI